MRRLRFYWRAGLALTVLVLLACRKAEPGPAHLTLRPGLSFASKIEPGSTRSFAFELRHDQYLALRVTQEAVDVTLRLRPPEGERWAPLDTQSVVPTPELLHVVAPRDGRYRLDVEAAGKRGEGTAQPFRLEVAELRPATARDRMVVEAQGELTRAEELRRRKDQASDLRALPLYREAIQLYKQAGETDGEGYARVQWARVLERQNRKEEEANALRGCLALDSAAQMPGTRAKAATMLAEVLSDLGESAEAEAVEREALSQWRRLGQPTYEAQVLNDLGRRATERGELAEAEGLYRQALRRWGGAGPADSDAAAVVLGNLAGVYSLAGEPQLALDTAEQGLARFSKQAPLESRAAVLERKGDALADLGRREASQKVFAEALQLCQGKPAALAQIERRLARRAYDQGNFAEAAKRFQSALTTLEATEDRPSAIAVRQDLAWTELKRGNVKAAEELFRRMSAAAGAAENRWIQPASLAGRARLERARAHLQSALALARQALDQVELLRREVGRTDLKTSVFASQQSYFDLAADLAMELYGQNGDRSLLVDAFEISERSRARRLLDLLSTGPPPQGPGSVEPRAARALSRAEERLSALRAAEAAGPEIEEAEREVRRAVLDLRREDGSSGTTPASFGGTPLPLRQIQSWIDRDTVLLEFDLGEDASYLWVVSRQHLSVHRLPRQQEVEALARQAAGVLATPGASAESVQGQQTLLSTAKLLVGEAMPELAARRWLVVMDGVLHALPLGALPNPQRPEEPILATHEIAYTPSASVAVRLAERAEGERRAGTGPRKDLALFADPVYEAERAGSRIAAGLPAVASGLLRLPRLSYSDDEARRILALVITPGRLDTRRYEATKARVLSGELADYRRLHFAVHGLPNESHPELSGLALSLFDSQGRAQDGILFAHEIARLHLPAELAVLSACQSGRGAEISGEGLVGLVHAFFTAGTARVVASDWAVNDQATAELMVLFYDGLLRRHLNPARALREAQLALAREGPWRRPYYWAGFVVQGGF